MLIVTGTKKTYRILVCDLNIQKAGHWLSYNQYIVDNFKKIESENPQLHVMFLFNKDASGLVVSNECVKSRLHFIDENLTFYSNLKDRYFLFRKVKHFAAENQIDHLIFMDLDRFQLPIFLVLFKFTLSGILFRPHHRIELLKNDSGHFFSGRLKRYKKLIAEKLLVFKKQVKNIFILSDTQGVKFLNKLHRSQLFKYLPEPVFTYSKICTTADYKKQEPYRFLIFGSFDDVRKNVTNILMAYDRAEFSVDTEIMLCGPSTSEFIEHLNSLAKTLPSIDNKKKKLSINVGFYSGIEMDRFFSMSDVCLLIYKNFYGSSALLGRSALHKIKVIGPNVGLLNEIIQQYGLGLTCDPDNVEEIVKALNTIQQFSLDDEKIENFNRTNSPEVFLKTLLEAD